MFSLIITIISIALVAALAVATIYYGGDAFNQGSSKAKASTIVNQAQQIAGAATLYKSAGNTLTGISVATSLVPNYLATVPSSTDATLTLDATEAAAGKVKVTGTVANTEVCSKITEIAGGSTQFSCTGGAFVFQG
jgi:hypothetical protein